MRLKRNGGARVLSRLEGEDVIVRCPAMSAPLRHMQPHTDKPAGESIALSRVVIPDIGAFKRVARRGRAAGHGWWLHLMRQWRQEATNHINGRLHAVSRYLDMHELGDAPIASENVVVAILREVA